MASDSTFLFTSYHKYNTQDNSQNTEKQCFFGSMITWSLVSKIIYLGEKRERKVNPRFSTKSGRSSDTTSDEWVTCYWQQQYTTCLSVLHFLPNEKRDLLQNCYYHIHLSIAHGICARWQGLKQWWETSQLDIVYSWQITVAKKQGHFKTN